jgi:hypothetical protein
MGCIKLLLNTPPNYATDLALKFAAPVHPLTQPPGVRTPTNTFPPVAHLQPLSVWPTVKKKVMIKKETNAGISKHQATDYNWRWIPL